MLRNLLIKSLTSNGFNISHNPACVQSVRWRRKPRWLPVAKSKLFKVPERHKLPIEEEKEWLRLNNNYKTQMRSVRAFFREEVQNKKEMVQAALTPADEEAEYQRCSGVNEEWNLEIAKIRNARLEKENAERRAFIQQRLEDKKVREHLELEVIEARVRKEKEMAPTFITSANIDQAIEQALANPVDFNFSIDQSGSIIKGIDRPGKPVEKQVEP